MSVDVEHANATINDNIPRQLIAYTFVEMHIVLASNVIQEYDSFNSIYVCGMQRCKECKIHVFLLFAAVKVHQAIWGVAAMSSTCHGNYACHIASLRKQHCLLNDTEGILTRGLLQMRHGNLVELLFAKIDSLLWDAQQQIVGIHGIVLWQASYHLLLITTHPRQTVFV